MNKMILLLTTLFCFFYAANTGWYQLKIILSFCDLKVNFKYPEYSNYGSVYYDDKRGFYFVANVIDKQKSIAYGIYNDSIETNGWGILSVRSGYSRQASNNLIMQAAGFLEGYLTAKYKICN